MQYISTRNTKQTFTFKDVFLNGLAADGGLYIPEKIPSYSLKELESLKELSYEQLAVKIIFNFCSDEFNEIEIEDLVNKSYKEFRVKNVVNIKRLENIILLELFHGPTLAFKDIAMQVIGNMYEKILSDNKKVINIVVATSGDTGAAAISALRGRKNINIFVLHPHKKISKVQRKLMTTFEENNVYNLAIEGNFDDCQKLVKSMFIDRSFNNEIHMSGVNSINWARIIAQTVYYFYCYLKLDKKKSINFSVPTGNFGDVYAGYLSKKMGLPIGKLIVATNQNDILHRAISSGKYIANQVQHTISPSMDIQVASNFERLIYDINDCNADKTNKIMQGIKNEREYLIEEKELRKIKEDFISESISEQELLYCIKKTYENHKIIIDPHTAVGLGALEKINLTDKSIVLSTAHPCKFPEAINKAINIKSELPNNFNYILNEKEKFDVIKNNTEEVKKYILNKLI